MTMTDKLNAYHLARLAETYSPDSLESPGAHFLASVADAFEEYERDADGDWLHEAADGAVPIYTHERWQVFVDLGAYNEDISDLGATGDATQDAAIALYMIAERLLSALAAAADEDDEEES